jgi:hypothetical protein
MLFPWRYTGLPPRDAERVAVNVAARIRSCGGKYFTAARSCLSGVNESPEGIAVKEFRRHQIASLLSRSRRRKELQSRSFAVVRELPEADIAAVPELRASLLSIKCAQKICGLLWNLFLFGF